MRPTLNLDFTNTQRLDPRVSFSRASTATYVDRFNNLKIAPVNTARFNFDSTTGECLGRLIEEQRTNRIAYSQNLTIGWNGPPSAAMSIEVFNGFSPFYTLSKTLSTQSELRAFYPGAASAGATDTLTIAFLAGSSANVEVGLHLAEDGAWGLSGNSSFEIIRGPGTATRTVGALIKIVGLSATVPTVLRITRTYISAGVGILVAIYPDTSTSTTIGASVKATRVQLEAGGFSTSYIPTNGAAATRAADVATETLSPWFSQAKGTLVWSGYCSVTVGTPGIFAISDGTINNRIFAVVAGLNGRIYFYRSLGGVDAYVYSSTFTTTGTKFKVALSWDSGNIYISLNGGAVNTATHSGLPALTTFQHGKADGYMVGHEAVCRYFPKTITGAELQALSY